MKNNEALRCLLCKKPKCSLQGCPVHTPVPECMALYRADKLDEAGAVLFQNNPLSAITLRFRFSADANQIARVCGLTYADAARLLDTA